MATDASTAAETSKHTQRARARRPVAVPNQLGLLAGGLADGTVCLWNPSGIVASTGAEPGADCLLTTLQTHTGPARALAAAAARPERPPTRGLSLHSRRRFNRRAAPRAARR